MCNYVRFYSYVAWMIIVNVYDLEVDSAPHKNVHSLNHELKNRRFQTLASDDDFDRSFTCTTCGVKLRHQDKARAMWLLKRHSVKNHIKLKPDGIWMQITMYWPANQEVSQNYWTVWHPRAGTKLNFLSWTLQSRPWFRRYNLERSSVSGCLLCKAVENMDWEVHSSKYHLFFTSSLN